MSTDAVTIDRLADLIERDLRDFATREQIAWLADDNDDSPLEVAENLDAMAAAIPDREARMADWRERR